ncbi:nucleoside triphosphate pyrophosphohydrolase [Fictibacillus sp. KIGAM418]|uniref:Nucleoside triphosphate pyrophosphohydrolase n=1 Tax=Fictibacillus marinisediminis TaxID=2878389 RepID=A0A9X2BDJ9_9BACL|nr:nucleoside triphosphate pyrophosphohydrolase [Fictibacillus marinisediminis]MCK6255132.1 nucleoside triphosphate pyrophosphohydrolase [Fictibacillus marinisediminis]
MPYSITILGLGAGDLDQLTVGVYRMLLKAEHVFVRTNDHPAVAQLEQEGVKMTFFDDLYEKHDAFEDVYREITSVLFQKASSDHIIYAVPGHPLVAEQTVQLLLKEADSRGVEVKVAGGKSFLDEMYTALKIDPIDGCQILDGTNLKKEHIQIRNHLIIVQVYDGFIASEVKLTLMEKYPDDFNVAVVTAAGSAEESIQWVPLYELDRSVTLNNLTAVYVPPVDKKEMLYRDFEHLRGIIRELRGPDGCPWDKKQTHESLKKYLIEEAYEVLEAIDDEDDEHLAEELGDVLLQVLLHAQIGEDEGYFSMDEVISGLADKMIRRHPHVFGDAEADTADEVLQNWEQIKSKEKGNEHRRSLLDGVAKGLPALHKAFDYQKKAAKAGFDWDEVTPILDKLREEFDEWKAAESADERRNEFGDMLFTMVNLGRFYGIHPEEALALTNQKFYARFRYIENELSKEGLTPEEASLEKMDQLWNQAKENL